MTEPNYTTYFGSLDNYRKGSVELVSGRASEYAFSNVFEVADVSDPYEKVVVGKNLEYVIEAVRAEGVSPWYTNSHDEFAICFDGEVRVDFIDLDTPQLVGDGSHLVNGEPKGKSMGYVILRRGHQCILPATRAYRFTSAKPSVLLLQTILGPLSVQKWKDICFN